MSYQICVCVYYFMRQISEILDSPSPDKLNHCTVIQLKTASQL